VRIPHYKNLFVVYPFMSKNRPVEDYLALRSVINKYETRKPPGAAVKSQDDLNVIKMDVERTYFDYGDKDVTLLRKELFNLLIRIPFEYVQGMNDVAAVLVYFYAESESMDEVALNSIDTKDCADDDSDSDRGVIYRCKNGQFVPSSTPNEYDNTVDQKIFEDVTEYEDITNLMNNATRRRMLTAVYHILKDKYLCLVQNEFKVYLAMNKVMLNMLNKEQKSVSVNESIRFMNYTLTWFSRILKRRDDVYFIFKIIIEEELCILFVIMFKFYSEKSIGNRKMFQLNLRNLKCEFKEEENEIRKENLSFGKIIWDFL
ncbi:putative Rab-GAP/TBC domain protein, partial [Trachipleistophora hominis]